MTAADATTTTHVTPLIIHSAFPAHTHRCILGGTDIEMKNAAGCTAAHAAATNGHQDLMELLTEKGIDLNFKCKYPLFGTARVCWYICGVVVCVHGCRTSV
jgi:hypothetical protein